MRMNKAEFEFTSLLGKYFTDYLPISVNASPHTIKSYKCAFRLLYPYLNEESGINVGQITFEMLDFDLLTNFFKWLTDNRKNSRTTAKQRMGALSSFAEYAQNRNLEAGYVFRNSLEKIYKKSFKRFKGKQRCAFTRDELEIFFSLPDTTLRHLCRFFVQVYFSCAKHLQPSPEFLPSQKCCKPASNKPRNFPLLRAHTLLLSAILPLREVRLWLFRRLLQ